MLASSFLYCPPSLANNQLMTSAQLEAQRDRRVEGMAFGLLGVLGFSFCAPRATRLAVASFDPIIVGLGRALIAACFAAPLLLLTGQKRPSASQWRSIAIVIAGVVIGFPMLLGAVVLAALGYAEGAKGA